MELRKAKTSISVGIVMNYVRIALFLILSLFYPPFLLSYVHKVDNGILNYATALLQIVTLLSFGIENSYVRFATKREKEGRLSKMNGSYLLLFGLVSLVITVVGIVLAFFYREGMLSIEEVPPSSRSLVFSVILIVTLSTAIDFFFSFFVWAEVYRNRFLLHQVALIVTKLLSIGCSCLALIYGGGILWVAIVALAVQFAYGLFNLVYCLHRLKMPISFGTPKELKREMLEIFRFSFFIFLTIAVSQIENNAGRVILSSTLGASSVTIFSYGLQFYTYAALLSKGVADTFAPKVNKEVMEGNDEEVHKTFLKASFVQMTVLFLALGGFALVGREFLALWLGNEELSSAELLQIYVIALSTLSLWSIPLSESLGVEIQRAYGKHRVLSVTNFVLAVLSLPLSVLFVYVLPDGYRIYGPLLGSAVFVLVGFVLVDNVYYKRSLCLPIGALFKDYGIVFGVASIAFLVPFLIFEYAIPEGAVSLLMRFLLKALLFLLLFLVFFFLVYRKRLLPLFARKGR